MRIVIRQLPYYDSHFLHIYLQNTVKYGILTDIFIVFSLLCLTFLAYKYYAYHNYYVGHSTYKDAMLSISSPVFSAEKGFLQRVFRYSAVALSFPATYIPLFSFLHSQKEKAAEKARRYFIKVYSLSFLRFICLLLLFS